MSDFNCSYTFPGTYGHTCGAPATHVAIMTGCEDWKDGTFYAYRCPECAKKLIKGLKTVPLDKAVHVNQLKSGRFVRPILWKAADRYVAGARRTGIVMMRAAIHATTAQERKARREELRWRVAKVKSEQGTK